MNCVTCGAELGPDDAFCSVCGAARPSEGAGGPTDDLDDLDDLPPPSGAPVETGRTADDQPAQDTARPPSAGQDPTQLPSAGQEPAQPPSAGQAPAGPPPSAGPGPASPGGAASARAGFPLSRNATLLAAGAAGAVVVLILAVVFLGGRGSSGPILGQGDAVVYDPSGTGRAVPSGPGGEPQELWTDDVDRLMDVAVRGAMVVLVVDDGADYELQAVDARTGEEIWSEGFDDDQAVVVGADDSAVVARRNFDADEVVVLDDAGQELWAEGVDELDRMQLLPGARLLLSESGESEVYDLATGDPLFGFDGYVAGVTGDSLVVIEDSEDVLLLDAAGDEVWSEGFDEGVGAAVGDGLVYVEEGDDEVIALDAGSGVEVWAADLEDDAGRLRAVPGIGVLVSVDGDTQALGTDGQELWDDNDPAGPLLEVGGRMLVFNYDGGDVDLLDAATGDRVADLSLADDESLPAIEESLINGVVGNALLVAEDGDLTAHDLSALQELWSVDTNLEQVYAIAVSDGLLVVIGTDDEDLVIAAFG